MRKYGRIDQNQPLIVRQLRMAGCTVAMTGDVGDGFPDLVVGFQGKNFLFEVKNPAKPKGDQKLKPAEKVFHDSWRGQVKVVHTAIQALDEICRG